MIPNYYDILGLSRDSTKAEIKKAYRRLALEYHPDVNKSVNAHDKFIAINEAYLILFDDEAREKYNQEYDFFKGNSRSSVNVSSSEKRTDYEGNSEYFGDNDLKNWARKARKQGSEYSMMSFDEFSKYVMGVVKETGFQLGNTILVFFGIILTMSGCGNIVIGLTSNGRIGNPVLGAVILPIGILLWRAAGQNWDKHA